MVYKEKAVNEIRNNVCVQSWSFRAFKQIPQLIEQLKKVNANGTELCGVHADFNDESKFEGVIGQFKAAGLQIVSIGVEGVGDEAAFEKRCKFVKAAARSGWRRALASKIISRPSRPSRSTPISSTSSAASTTTAATTGSAAAGSWLTFIRMPARDWAWRWTRRGACRPARSIKMAEQFIDRLYGVHFKDFVFDRSGHGHDVVVGEGNLDLKKLVEIVKTKAPAGCISVIEYER